MYTKYSANVKTNFVVYIYNHVITPHSPIKSSWDLSDVEKGFLNSFTQLNNFKSTSL